MTFTVVAIGTSPFSYQWLFGGMTLLGGTNSTLSLSNVQSAQAGTYSVIVSNAVGSLTSSGATLTVNAAQCVPAPAGLVSWWRGESNTLDQLGNNNGVLVSGASFGPGAVGTGFSFSHYGAAVALGNPVDLQLQTFTIESWIKRGSATSASSDVYQHGYIFGSAWGGYALALWDDGRLMLTKVGYSNVTTPTPMVTDTNFHHVAVTKMGSTVIFYVDGVAQTVGAYDPGFVFNGTSAIGARGTDYATSFLGTIDEVGIYNRALSGGEVQSIYNAGSYGKCPVTIPPYIASQPASQSVTAGGTAAFAVVAGGTAPLSYQWLFNGTMIPGGTNNSLTLNNVSQPNAGSYSVIVTNVAGSVTSSVAVLTVTLPLSTIQVAGATVAADGTVTVPINLIANGNENAASFSLNFDPTILTYQSVVLGSGAEGGSLLLNPSQAATGQVGVAVAMPAGATFGAGTQQLVVVSFGSPINASATSTTIGFGDAPIKRLLADASGNPLVGTFASGTLLLPLTQLEGDVYPRPNGDQALTVNDWVLVGRYVARLDSPTNAAEFQKADCAPRSTLGDGLLTVSDWVQAGRYAAGL